MNIKLPKKFYADHRARECGQTGKIVSSTKNYYIVELDQIALDDLIGDALYYIECADMFDPRLPALVSSAKATLRAINNQPTKGE
jgi:hypothetical protein